MHRRINQFQPETIVLNRVDDLSLSGKGQGRRSQKSKNRFFISKFPPNLDFAVYETFSHRWQL